MRPLGRERAQEVAQPAHALGVEAVGRLVEDQQLGIAEQRRRQAEPLPHAERVALHAPVLRAASSSTSRSTSSTRASGSPVGAARACAGGCGRSGPDGSRSPRAPRRRATPAARARAYGWPNTSARPLVGFARPEQHPERRRLAGAVRAEEAGDGAGVELERELVDGGELAEALRQRVGGDDGGHRRDSSRRRQNSPSRPATSPHAQKIRPPAYQLLPRHCPPHRPPQVDR